MASFQIINVKSEKHVADVTERTFSEHVGAQQNSIDNELDGAKLASAGKYFIAYIMSFYGVSLFTVINFMHTWGEYYTNTTLWAC